MVLERCSLVEGVTLYFFSLAKYSRTIIRINPLTEVPFSSAVFLNCSITSGEKNTFVLSLLAFGLGDTIHHLLTMCIISPFNHHVKRYFQLFSNTQIVGRYSVVNVQSERDKTTM